MFAAKYIERKQALGGAAHENSCDMQIARSRSLHCVVGSGIYSRSL